MDPYYLDKLWDFAVNMLSVLVGGGAIVAYIELRRYQREKKAIQREEQRVAVDVISSEISVEKWVPHSGLSTEDKLRVYEHQLDGTVKSYIILLEFLLRNTTNTEVVVTRLATEEPGVPERPLESFAAEVEEVYEIYDLQTGGSVPAGFDELTTLQPSGTLTRALWIQRFFDEQLKLETPPSTIAVTVETSGGREKTHNISLRNVRAITKLRSSPKGSPYYAGAATPPPRVVEEEDLEDEIPF